MKRSGKHPINPWISNGFLVDFYLNALRSGRGPITRLIETILNTEIACPIPDKLFLPHPYGIILGAGSKLGENVTLMQQVTLGGKDPWCAESDLSHEYPTLQEGVYVGAGAKILGPVTIGEWSIIGANAVITKSIPSYATVVGFNKIIKVNDASPFSQNS